MKIRLLIALFLTQYSNSFASVVEDDAQNSFEEMRTFSLSRTLQAPVLNYDDMRVLFSRAPCPQQLILKDALTGAQISWQLKWHSSHVRCRDLIQPNSDYTPCVTMQSAEGLDITYRNNRFVSYRVEFEHTKTKEIVSPFYNVFYLNNPTVLLSTSSPFIPLESLVISVPKVSRETITVPAPEMHMDRVEPFMKDKIREGRVTLPDPTNSKKSYQWRFVWHSTFNKDFLMKFPKAYFTYHVSFIEDRGLEEGNTVMPFASYKVYVENIQTYEIVDPFLIFYLQSPALA